MRLLFLCERVDAEGGMETYLRTVIPEFVARGDDVRVIGRIVGDANAFGAPTDEVAWSDEHDPPSATAAARVAEIARAFAPDVVVAQNVLDAAPLEAAFAHAPRSVYQIHDHRPFCPNGDRLYPQGGGICSAPMGKACAWHALVHGCAYGPRPATLQLIRIREQVRDAVARADTVVTLSNFVGDLAARNGVSRERLRVLTPPLADAAYAETVAPRPARDIVLFAGRVMPSKGARALVRAIALLPDDRRPVVQIAGTGPDLDATLEEAGNLGVDAHALGRLGPSELRGAYDAATLVALPSLWAEPFGLVGIEAFARGRPVAAFDAGGVAEWLGDGGLAVRRGDEGALAAAIARLLEPAAWNAASTAAVRIASGFRLSPHVDALRALLA